MNFRWNYEPPTTENEACAEGLAEEVRVPPAIAQMLVARGIRTPIFNQGDDLASLVIEALIKMGKSSKNALFAEVSAGKKPAAPLPGAACAP